MRATLTLLLGLLFLNSGWGQQATLTSPEGLDIDIDAKAMALAVDTWEQQVSLETETSWVAESILASRSNAALIRSMRNGDWNDAATWSCGCIPQMTDDVVVEHRISLAEGDAAFALNLVIEVGGQLTDAGMSTLQLGAGLACAGSALLDNSLLLLDGAGSHVVSGQTLFDQVTVANGASLMVHGSLEIQTHLQLDGAFADVTGGELRLTQGDWGRATVQRINGGEVRGPVTRELTLAGTPNSALWVDNLDLTYQYFAIGLEGVTLDQLNDDFPTSGFVGADAGASGNANIRFHQESNLENNGWVDFGNVTDTLPVWESIAVFVPVRDTYVVEFTGTLPATDATYDMTATSLMNINWLGSANNSGLDLHNLMEENAADTLVKCWNTQALRWDLFVDGFGTSSNGYIEPNQVCQIAVDDARSIPFANDFETKSLDRNNIESNVNPLARVSVGLSNVSGFSDEALLVVTDNASFGWESSEDAPNHFGNVDACDLYFRHGGIRYGISNVGFEGKTLLEAEIMYAGSRPIDNEFTVEILDVDLGEYCAYIQWEGTDTQVALEEAMTKEFSVDGNANNTNILIGTLVIVPPVRVQATSTACEAEAFSQVAVTPGGDGPWDIELTDAEGVAVEGTLSGNGVTMDFLDLPSGTYNGVVATEGELACGVQTFEASVISPTTIDMDFDVQHDCGEGGEVTVSSEGGAMPVNYKWDNDNEGSTLSALAPGNYTVIATDANGCKDTTSVEIKEAPTLAWTSQNTTCDSEGPTAVAFQSSNASTSWNVAITDEEGNVVDATVGTGSFELTDLGAGTFAIEMNVEPMYGCDTRIDEVTLLEPVAMDLQANTQVQCNDWLLGQAEVEVSGGVGEVTLTWDDGHTGNVLGGLVAGTYVVTATDELGCQESLEVDVAMAPLMTVGSVSPGCEGEGTTELTMLGQGETTWDFTVYNGNGDVYASFNETDGQANLANLPSGTYHVVGVNAALTGCPQQDESVVLIQPTDLNVERNVVPLGCDGVHRGEIALDIETSASPVNVVWSHGAFGATLTDLGPGQYYATVSDANGCTQEVRVALDEAPAVVADFEVPNAGFTDGTNGTTMTFTNTSEGATAYTWYFGDTNVPSNDVHATHTFAEPGTYDVFLNAWNDYCSHTVRQTVVVSVGETNDDDELGLFVTGIAEGQFADIGAPATTPSGWVMDMGSLAQGTKMVAYDLTGRALCAPAMPDGNGKIWVESDQWPSMVLLRLVHEPTNNIRTWKMVR